MKIRFLAGLAAPVVAVGFLAVMAGDAPAQQQATQQAGQNALIDFGGFQKVSADVMQIREARRVDVDTFLHMAGEEDTVILDTRSKAMYDLKHIKGAKHLNFSDFTAEKLKKVIPSKDTRVLIYCNNNFVQDSAAFANKAPSLALNIPTFINLYGYGYENIYELGPAVDEDDTPIEFEGTSVQ